MKLFFSAFLFCSSSIFISLEKHEKTQKIHLNFTEIGDFIEALKQQTQHKNPMEKVTKNGREILTEITQNFQNSAQKDIQNLLDEILDKVSNANGLIAEKCFGKMGQQKAKANEAIANGNAIEEELSGELARHELSRMGSKVIKDTMFNYYQENLIAKSKVYKWWIRYRYKMNSAICQNDVPINEIRTSFFQYYFDAFSNFNEINRQIKKEKPCLAEVVAEMSKLKRKWSISTEITEEEQRDFDPFKELPQKKLDILTARTENGTPIYVLTERFCRKYLMGHFYEAIGVNHRAVKVYGTEFHFANALGLFIHEKQRIRPNPERGIKFSQVGITHKTQWEVQQIFDKFIEVYEENGQFEEGKFGVEKYDYFEHNCVHFAREFVEALMEGDKALKGKKWPPKVLRQSHFNKNKYKNLAMCLMG